MKLRRWLVVSYLPGFPGTVDQCFFTRRSVDRLTVKLKRWGWVTDIHDRWAKA